MEGKTAKDSMATLARTMFPTDANAAGNVFGGAILRQVDEIAGIVAKRHTRSNVVTASIDHMNFLAPVYVGDLLILEARINCTGRTSMEVEVEIRAEDLDTGEVRAVGNSFLTMVALGKDGKPIEIPPIVPETEEERRRFEEGLERRKRRLEELGKRGG